MGGVEVAGGRMGVESGEGWVPGLRTIGCSAASHLHLLCRKLQKQAACGKL